MLSRRHRAIAIAIHHRDGTIEKGRFLVRVEKITRTDGGGGGSRKRGVTEITRGLIRSNEL